MCYSVLHFLQWLLQIWDLRYAVVPCLNSESGKTETSPSGSPQTSFFCLRDGTGNRVTSFQPCHIWKNAKKLSTIWGFFLFGYSLGYCRFVCVSVCARVRECVCVCVLGKTKDFYSCLKGQVFAGLGSKFRWRWGDPNLPVMSRFHRTVMSPCAGTSQKCSGPCWLAWTSCPRHSWVPQSASLSHSPAPHCSVCQRPSHGPATSCDSWWIPGYCFWLTTWAQRVDRC